MNVGAAHAGSPDANQDFVVANLRLRHVLHHEAGFSGGLHERFHASKYSVSLEKKEARDNGHALPNLQQNDFSFPFES
jgi:hypothetical protein